LKLAELNPTRFVSGIAFLCPCCKREYLTAFFTPTPYAQQRELMRKVVSDVDGATWVPSPAFEAYGVANENNLDRITIRPTIDASGLGHGRWFVSNGEIEKA
jgi:hypothetical protein